MGMSMPKVMAARAADAAYNVCAMVSGIPHRSARALTGLLALLAGGMALSLPGCLLLFTDSPSTPAAFAAGWTIVRVERANGTRLSALLYYPALATGRDAPVDPTGGPYPAVTFGHGWLVHPRLYDSTLDYLATQGYVVIAAASQTQLFPNHPKLAADMRHCLTYLEQENAREDSFLFGLVNPDRFGVAGHSMGGGASLLAAAADDRIKAVVALAAAETWPESAIAAAADIHVPICYIVGSQDTFTPLEIHTQPMYDNSSPPRQLLLLFGGYHCGFIDPEVPLFCDSGTMDHQLQLDITWERMVEFFDTYLKSGQTVEAQSRDGPLTESPPVSLIADQ